MSRDKVFFLLNSRRSTVLEKYLIPVYIIEIKKGVRQYDVIRIRHITW